MRRRARGGGGAVSRVEEHVVRYFPNCPPTTNVTVVAGFTHDTAILWIRNLVRIVTGDPMDDETDHCFGMVWTNSGGGPPGAGSTGSFRPARRA